MTVEVIVFVFIFGLVIGSFLNVVIYRLPEHQSIVSPGSHCPHCGKPIKPYDNIPLMSYMILRGRCRYCGNRISLRYPAVELITGLLAAGLFIKYGLTIDLMVFFILSTGLTAITFIDIDHGIIPNSLSYPGIIIGFASSFFVSINNPISSIIGMLTGAGILFVTAFTYKAVTGVEGMGMGDVKLMAAIGAFLGWEAAIFTVIISACIGALAGVTLILFAGKGRRYAIPYGPFISLSAVVYLFYGHALISLYLRMIGYA
ncbi:MAG: prepilin peptidase [Deltaproteobacteria bacterium]|nr:prepilin peptidase [Deltaproteobacteria bacterium]